jgi:hypothetical protein
MNKEDTLNSKISRHPDKKEIISKLLNGESVKKIEEWIKAKYPRTKRYHISYMTLQKFRTNHLNIKGELLEDIKNRRHQDDVDAEKNEIRVALLNSSEYQKKIDEIVSKEIDVNRRLLEMEALISSRLEYYFNQVSSSERPNTFNDKALLDYINALRAILSDWKKYVDGFADKKIEHNINIQVVDTQVKVLKEAMFEVLSEMDPQLILQFMDKLNQKMQSLNYDSPEYNNYLLDVSKES